MRAVFACLLAMIIQPAQAAPDYAGMALAAVDQYVVQGYRRFGDHAAEMDRVTAAFCARPDAASLQAVRAGFHAAMDAWQRMQLITFGPAEAFHRGQRVHFWPDKKNIGERQLRLLLKTRNADVLDESRIASASVAIQGLPALEFLLFEDGAADQILRGEDSAFRCRVVTAISANLVRLGQELLSGWTEADGFRAAIVAAGSPASPYVDHRQAASRFFNALHGQLEAVAEAKLAYPLGSSPEAARVQRAESWRSQRSLRNIALNLEAVKAVSQAAFVPALPAAVGRKLTATIDDALVAAGRVAGPMETAMKTGTGWRSLAELKAKVKAVARVLESDAGSSLGLQVGFNALDGD